MSIGDRSRVNFITRGPLLINFVLSYIFFWLFLALIIIALSIFHIKPDTLPTWLISLVSIFGSWTGTEPAVAGYLAVLRLLLVMFIWAMGGFRIQPHEVRKDWTMPVQLKNQ